jgi:hypothetical protein
MAELRIVPREYRFQTRSEYERELESLAENLEGGISLEDEYDELLDEYIAFCEEHSS